MKKLLLIEWLTYSRYRTMQVVVGLYLVFTIGIFVSFESISIGPFDLFTGEAFRFPYVWQNVSFLSKLLNLYLGVAVVLMVSNEFSYSTLKQHIIDGLTRKQVVAAKSLTVILLSMLSTMLIIVVGAILGMANTSIVTLEVIFGRTDFLLGHFLHVLGVLSMAMMIAFLVERNGLAVILFVSYTIFGEAIIRNVLGFDWVQYFPMRNLTMLNLYPYVEVIPDGFGVIPDNVDPVRMLVASAYILLFHYVSWRKVRSADLT